MRRNAQPTRPGRGLYRREPHSLPRYNGELRQLAILDLGHEEPTLLLTNGVDHRRAVDGQLQLAVQDDRLLDGGYVTRLLERVLTNQLRRSPATLIGRYAQRTVIENNIAEGINFSTWMRSPRPWP
jgi:hypothetical protein